MQQAIFVTEVGKPLSKGTRPIPSPPQSYVQIKVIATQLLPHDTYGRDSGLFIGDKLPFILGTNIAGIVTALPETESSSSLSKYKLGDVIFGLGSPFHPNPDMSGLQEYALLEIAASAKIPAGFTAEQVVTFPVNAVTSYEALFHPTMGFGFPPLLQFPIASTSTSPSNPPKATEDLSSIPQALLIIGGNSSVGRLALQLASLIGIPQILTIASSNPDTITTLKSLGATHIIDRHLPPSAIAKTVHEITGPSGLTHIYDCVSWTYPLALSLLSTTKPSTLLTLHPKEPAEKQLKEEGREGLVTVRFVVGNNRFFEPLTEGFWSTLPELIVAGKLRVGEFRVVEWLDDLKAIEEGLDGYRNGERVVPVVVRV